MLNLLLAAAAAGAGPPPLPAVGQLSEQECSAPGPARDNLLQNAGAAEIAYMKASTEYWDARMHARLDQLYSKARWTDEQRQDFAGKLMDDPDLEKLRAEARDPVMDAVDQLYAQGGATLTDENMCRQMVRVLGAIDLAPVQRNREQQWSRIVELTNREATKLGFILGE